MSSAGFEVLSKDRLHETVTRMTLRAPEVARHARPGQFVIVIPEANGERIPLTVARSDAGAGSITLIFQEVGFSTKRLGRLAAGDAVAAVLGPLGHATDIRRYGTVIGVGGGVGIAEIYPVLKAMKEAGNRVESIIGARSKDLLILQDELGEVSDVLTVTTDDGSAGTRGLVTDVLRARIASRVPDLVYAVGPVPMMKSVAETTRPQQIPTLVSLNPIMVDATGMCGVCRCRVKGKTVFGCVDGPEFNAHEVDFDHLAGRLRGFKDEERRALEGV